MRRYGRVDQLKLRAGAVMGFLPLATWPATLATCVNCHQGVVNGSGSIIDNVKHINGKINAFASERPF